MADILDRIIAYKRAELAAAMAARPLPELERAARAADPPRGFAEALENKRQRGAWPLIAEVKKASPSKGLIRADFDPAALARAYESGGAACLSVLTDSPSFQGSADHLIAARGATALPVLRKDFMLDPYQAAEARAWGADCILIVMACVSDAEARALVERAHFWDMDVLAEVHDEAELQRALKLETRLIGINNRDLKTFQTSLETTERLVPLVPTDRLLISESGISEARDLARLARAGVHAVLVGESLMRQHDVAAATRALLNVHEARAGADVS